VELDMAGLVCQYAEAMNDAANSLLHGAKVRGADYRMRAEELRMRAAAITFADIQSSLLEVANTYDALAQAIENAAEKQRSPDPSESPCSDPEGGPLLSIDPAEALDACSGCAPPV
jgi:hypothetical protein